MFGQDRYSLSAILLAGLAASSATAQTGHQGIEQIEAPSAGPELQQVQAATRDKAELRPYQVTVGQPAYRAPTQLQQAPRTAQAPEPLSRTSEGRTPQGVQRLEGADRCDPAANTQKVDCSRVIEARSADYQRPDPATLSPEQRILAEQQARTAGALPRVDAGRLGSGNLELLSYEEQGIAAIAAAQNANAAAMEKPKEEDAAKGLPAGLLEAIAAGGGQAPPP